MSDSEKGGSVKGSVKMNQSNFLEVISVLEADSKLYDIFKHCPYEILREVRIKKYHKNAFLLEQNEVHNTFYLLVKGYVDVFVVSEQGKKYYLNTYSKGQIIGELEMFEQKPYMSRIESRGSVTMLELSRENYLKWLSHDCNFSQYVLKTLCNGTYVSMQKMGNNTLYTLKQRICQFLIENSNENGTLHIPLSAELLSTRMAVTTRSVNRVLKELRDKKILEMCGNHVVIRDYTRLFKEKEEK